MLTKNNAICRQNNQFINGAIYRSIRPASRRRSIFDEMWVIYLQIIKIDQLRLTKLIERGIKI